MFSKIGLQISDNFGFCVGGIGDAIIFLSTLDKQQYPKNIVYWANNKKTISNVFSLFPQIKKSIVTDNYFSVNSMIAEKYYWHITSAKSFQQSYHIPKNLKYGEWANIINVFENYGLSKTTDVFKQLFYDEKYSNKIIVQPYSSSIEKYKKKYITKQNIENIINTNSLSDIIFIGSDQDHQRFKNEYNLEVDFNSDIKLSFILGTSCKECHSCDSWIKTLTAFNNIPTYYYVSEKTVDYSSIFGIDYDPGDKVFIKDWGLNIVNQFGYNMEYLK